MLVQSLEQQSSWPNPVVVTLSNVTKGSYTAVVDYGIAEFRKTVEVKIEGGGEGESGESGSNTGLIVGVSVPIIIILVFCIVVAYICLKRRMKRPLSSSRSYHVSSSNVQSRIYSTPPALIYHNQGVDSPRARIDYRREGPNPHPMTPTNRYSSNKPNSPPRPQRPSRPPRPTHSPHNNIQIRLPQDTEI